MSKKAARERQFRQREQQKKHFNGPMRRFLEVKYPEIYTEYKELYDLLSANHPHARDLVKTCTFKTWICTNSRVLNQSVSDQNNNNNQVMLNEAANNVSDQNNNNNQVMLNEAANNDSDQNNNNNNQAM